MLCGEGRGTVYEEILVGRKVLYLEVGAPADSNRENTEPED